MVYTFVTRMLPPSDHFIIAADVLKARLKTTGVVEHTFLVTSGSNRGVEWRFFDVGGARNQRQAWAPYFEDGGYP
jgi:hypothetical protein